MLYIAVDQHAKQLTVSVRNDAGDVILRRQVSTEWAKVRAFWDGIREQSPEGCVVILEVCGLNDWLVALLTAMPGCQLVLVQAPQRQVPLTTAGWHCQWRTRSRISPGRSGFT
jgi:transposase